MTVSIDTDIKTIARSFTMTVEHDLIYFTLPTIYIKVHRLKYGKYYIQHTQNVYMGLIFIFQYSLWSSFTT